MQGVSVKCLMIGQKTMGGSWSTDGSNEHWKKFFNVKVTKHWNGMSRETVASPSLKTVQTCPNMFMCDLL